MANTEDLTPFSEVEEAVSVMEVIDYERDGDIDLLCMVRVPIGDESESQIWVFKNDGSGSFMNAEYVANHLAVTQMMVADLDGDGDDDFIVCESHRQLYWYENLVDYDRIEDPLPAAPITLLYPQPACERLFIRSDLPLEADLLSIVDLHGRIVPAIFTTDAQTLTLDLQSIPAGCYQLQLGGRFIQSFVVVK